ncbi:2-hydroxyacid dehydrogenase [Halomonas huangheensis]|uniref:D-isomer specific 2-hydroxyacid dehydrogenase NAD-binding domain-containing protein n=1 Tax=Halomonas huangheensis TaxID=1178482 RepID=W1N8R9_9GAMM|nr:glyoxylate/hydroxypyruvate reductase A [Halomonas huangheensis]ALM53447.1 glyoxylate/hydroxypyruvate reductase A [Halomonas huangheensis]ERL51879.1 hypothetical protein BJB45_11985 [Halomonas huangheensis]
MRILVHISNAESWRDEMARRLPQAEIKTSQQASPEWRAGVDYLAAWKPDEALLRECSGLKAILNLGAGVDALLANPALPANVPIIKLRDAGMATLIADYVHYALLHFQRDFDRYAQLQRQRRWQPHEVVDKSEWGVGVLGLGAIGTSVAQHIAEEGFPVYGWSRSPKQVAGIECHHGDDGLEFVLRHSTSLVLLLPDTPATHQLMNAERLALLPQGASLINPGRGTLIDEASLLEALGDDNQPGRLRGAVLDAFPVEPLSETSPLWSHPRIIVTPHMAGPTPLHEALDQVVTSIEALEAGEPVESIDRQAGY